MEGRSWRSATDTILREYYPAAVAIKEQQLLESGSRLGSLARMCWCCKQALAVLVTVLHAVLAVFIAYVMPRPSSRSV